MYERSNFKCGFEDGTWLIFIPLSRSVTRLLLNRATNYVLSRFDVPRWGNWSWIRVRFWCSKRTELGGEEEEEEAYYCNLNAMFRLHYTPLQWMNKVAWNLYSKRWLCCYRSAQPVYNGGLQVAMLLGYAGSSRSIKEVGIASFDRSTPRRKACLVIWKWNLPTQNFSSEQKLVKLMGLAMSAVNSYWCDS